MAPTFKTDFKGTGSMEEFVKEMSLLLESMNNIKVQMPPYYAGAVPTLAFDGASLVFDMGEALIFSLENTEWSFISETTEPVSYEANVEGGKLALTVDTCP